MKRIGNLYEKIISWENLLLADKNARRGKLSTYGVRVHDRNWRENMDKLHEVLLLKKFKSSPYRVDKIQEKKERVLYKLPHYPDHILEYAIVQVLEPIWIKTLPYNTYSSIKKRGTHAARKRVKEILKDEKRSRYCLKLDIKKFYPSIEHDVLKMIIRRKIKCQDTLNLLDEIIDSVNGYPDPLDMTKVCQGRSLPIGRYLSPYLANLVLGYLLHQINEQGILGVLYADDGTFFAETKEALHNLLIFIDSELKTDLHLQLKDNYQIFPVAKNRYDKSGRGVDFVGFVFYREQVCMRKGIKKNFCRAVSRQNKRQPPMTPKEYKQGICSWLGWAKYSDSRHLLKTVIKKEYYASIL